MSYSRAGSEPLPPVTPERFISLHCVYSARKIRVELSAANGQLTLSGVAGLVFESGDGESDSFLAFTGHPGDVNRALRGAIYRGDPDWNTHGAVPSALIIRTSNSHVGLGGIEPVAVEAYHKLW